MPTPLRSYACAPCGYVSESANFCTARYQHERSGRHLRGGGPRPQPIHRMVYECIPCAYHPPQSGTVNRNMYAHRRTQGHIRRLAALAAAANIVNNANPAPLSPIPEGAGEGGEPAAAPALGEQPVGQDASS